MEKKNLFDLDRLISFRRDIHQHPEAGFEEVRTSQKIIDYLLSIGVEKSNITRIAKTGLLVDIKGKAPPVKPQQHNFVHLDALVRAAHHLLLHFERIWIVYGCK